VQAAFFHNGAFTKLEDAIRYHLNTSTHGRTYNPIAAGLDRDLTYRIGPIESVLARLDPLLLDATQFSADEFENLVVFVKHGLLDPRAEKQNLCKLVPASVPSGLPTMHFEGCPKPK
jgi:cytochrome c peroxidase